MIILLIILEVSKLAQHNIAIIPDITSMTLLTYRQCHFHQIPKN